MKKRFPISAWVLVLIWVPACFSCASRRGAASAEEYFSLGTAYFDLGKYEEAERWFNRARMVDKTKTASEYNLGRIAFETGRYEEAIKIFERILNKDPNNVMVLKAAAYTRIKTGDLAKAEALYNRVLALVPESADSGYNHALVLFAMNQPEQAEAVLNKYRFSLAENDDALLLLARIQRAQDKVEAANSYHQWLAGHTDPQIRYEYAQVLEKAKFYSRALEEYRLVLQEIPQDDPVVKRSAVRYTIARLLLIADPEGEEGITELRTAVSEGFSDMDMLKALLEDQGISDAHKEDIQRIIDRGAAPAGESGEGLETDVEGGSDGSQE
jgi:tetratricopeptide (TPR) repeat protein